MNKPLISIVVPSYNQASFLEQCLCSILDQSYPNIEIIVIDGGSTDGSVDVINRYRDRLTYWVSEPDNGQSHAINKGFQRAQGDIVAWLNSDDVYFPGAVSLAVKRFQENPSLSLFYGNCVFIDEQGGFLRYFTEIESWNKNRLLNYGDFIMQPTTFFLREKLQQVGYLDESLHYGMDWDLWCKLANVGNVHFERQVIAANREYGATKTSSGSWARLWELLKIQRRHITGYWPHAFFGYCSTEFHLKAHKTTSFFFKALWKCAAYSTYTLSPSAIKQNRLLYPQTFIYGLKRHSSEVPGGEATLYLPLLYKSAALSLRLLMREGTIASIVTPDSSEVLFGDGGEQELILHEGEKTIEQGYWCVNVAFKTKKGVSTTGHILRADWLRA